MGGGAAGCPDAADVALERITTHAVLALISALPPDQAEIIALRVVAGLAAHDVARLVGKSPGRCGWPRIAVFAGSPPRWTGWV